MTKKKDLLKNLFLIVCMFLFSFNVFSEENGKNVIEKEVPYGSTLKFYFLGLKRFLNVKPEFISAQKTDKDTIEVNTTNIGKGLLIVWTSEGRFVIKVDVVRPVAPPSKSSIINEFREKSKHYFILESNIYSDYYKSTEEGNGERKNNILYSDWTLSGPTPYGIIGYSTNLINDIEESKNEVDKWKIFLNDGKFGKIRNFNLQYGYFNSKGKDNYIEDVIIKGFSVSNSRKIKKKGFIPDNINVYYGSIKRREMYSGVYFSNELQNEEKRDITGFNIEYNRKFKLPRYDEEFKTRHEIFYRHYFDAVNNNKNDILYSNQTKWGNKKIEFDVLDFDILSSLSFSYYGESGNLLYDFDFESIPHLEGDYQQTGRRSTLLNLEYLTNYKRGEFFLKSIGAQIGFRQDYIETETEDGYSSVAYDYELTGKGKIYDINTKINYNCKDYTNLIIGNKQKDWSVFLNRNWELLCRKFNTFLNYRNTKVEYEESLLSDRNTDNYSWGVSFKPFEKIRMFLTGNNSTIKNDSQKVSELNSYSTGMSYNKRFLPNLNLNTSLTYTKTNFKNYGENSSSTDTKNIGLYTDLNYFFTKIPGSAYIRVEAKKIDEETQDYYEYRVKTGLSMKFAVFPGFFPKCNIEGNVFKDNNGNGVFDEGDEPLEGVRIRLSDGERETVTDKNGYYKFENFRGLQVKVAINLADVSKGYTFTTLSEYNIKVKNKETYKCDFGMIISNQIWGRVYADINDSGEFEAGYDRILPNIIIKLNNQMTSATDLSGLYRFVSLNPGEYEIKLDYTRLPVGFYSKMKLKRKVVIEEGKVVKQDFPFGVDRKIIGYVFIDKNNNKEYEPSIDEPVKDVLVKCAGKSSKTNKKGRFILKKLPYGEYEIKIDLENHPELELSAELPIVNLTKDPITLRNIRIPLKTKGDE